MKCSENKVMQPFFSYLLIPHLYCSSNYRQPLGWCNN